MRGIRGIRTNKSIDEGGVYFSAKMSVDSQNLTGNNQWIRSFDTSKSTQCLNAIFLDNFLKYNLCI